jgi:DNA-binding transcriptional MocR family regulator
MNGVAFGLDVLGSGGPRTLTSAVLERLRADILSTRLVPGQKLHIAGLAKQFSVSLAAVREALSRLVADGLVQASDQRGFRVSPVSPADLEDVTRTRIDIEGLTLRRFRGAQRRSLSPAGRPGDPQRGVDRPPPRLPPRAGRCLRLAVAARVSRHPARTERTLSPAFDPPRNRQIPRRRGRTRRDRGSGTAS